MRRMFGIDKEKELKVEGLCLCVDWSRKKLEAVSAGAVNRGMVKGFVLLSQRYLRMCMYVCLHGMLGIYACMCVHTYVCTQVSVCSTYVRMYACTVFMYLCMYMGKILFLCFLPKGDN